MIGPGKFKGRGTADDVEVAKYLDLSPSFPRFPIRRIERGGGKQRLLECRATGRESTVDHVHSRNKRHIEEFATGSGAGRNWKVFTRTR